MSIIHRARNRRGQSMAEYAIVLTVVIGAIVAMQLYVKRGLQAKVKDVTDVVGAGLTGSKTNQYEPYYASSDFNVTSSQKSNEQYNPGGTVFRDTQKEETTRTGRSSVAVSKE